ncbi:MAG TPA: zf-HC2 domain-containing protein [Pyrinomonadaceae bacterium]|nr:zf-HC2 domain-containing protein [Pyrinomonadaceae bacterium]
MKDTSFYNSSCGFDGDLAGYLYGEIKPDEKQRVDSHLAGCNECAMEIASVSAAKFAVEDWRRQEFTGLKTPSITIETNVTSSSQVWSWAALRSNFQFSLPIAGVAAALIIVGFSLLVRIGAPNVGISAGETAANDVSVPNSLPQLPVQETTSNLLITNDFDDPAKDDLPADVTSTSVKDSKRRMAPERPSIGRLRFAGARRPVVRPSEISVAKQKSKAPRLNNFDEKDDETLRLEDLFAEIETS